MSDNNSGVRNLRAMFENQSAASSPEPRGRSPAKFNTDTSTPTTSKIRASFVSVEPSANVATRDLGATKGTADGLNSPTAQRRQSFSLSADADDDTIAELKKEVSQEKEERKNSAIIPEAVPEQAVETRESSQAPPPIRDVETTMPNLGSIMKGSDFPEPQALVTKPKNKKPVEADAAPELASDDIAKKLAALSLADKPADNPDKTVTGVQEKASLKPADLKDETTISGGEALPPPTEVLPSANAVTASEPASDSTPPSATIQTPEAIDTPEPTPAPAAAVETSEIIETTPVADVVENDSTAEVAQDVPVTEIVQDAPATEAVEEVPTTKVVEDAAATEVVEDTPATEIRKDAPTTEIVEGSLASEPAEIPSVTEPAEAASTTKPVESPISTDVLETASPIEPVETASSIPEVAESAPPTKKISVPSSNPTTNGKATQKPPAISTARTGSTKASSAKSPLPRSPGVARLPKTPTTPKHIVPTSSAKSPAPAKESSRAAVSKNTTASTKLSTAPKESSKATISKEPTKVSAPIARTSRSTLRQSTAASSTNTVAKGKSPVVEHKPAAARSSSAVSASKEPKVTSAAPASKDSKEAAKAHTTSPGGFKKPRPKSPTKPVGLPSRLTAPTAASSAKQGEDAKVTRKPSTASRVSQPRAAAAPAAKKPTSRQSLVPSTAPAKRPESRASTAGGANEGFLARMMRPTTSSASKTHDKPASPPRRGGSVRTAHKPTTGPESTIAKGKKKVAEVAHKAKEAVTNGHDEEHAATEESGHATAEQADAGATEDEKDNTHADTTDLPSEQPAESVESIATPENNKIVT